MQYTKPMIELVYEIRRLVPSELKPGVKLANPNLFFELIEHYQSGAKTVTKALIRELLTLAGDPWQKELDKVAAAPGEAETKSNTTHITKMYRGTVSLEDNPRSANTPKTKKKLVYRGHVIG